MNNIITLISNVDNKMVDTDIETAIQGFVIIFKLNKEEQSKIKKATLKKALCENDISKLSVECFG